MESVIGKFISLYLLLPVAAVILGVVMLFAAKKNRLLNNKRTIFYFLSTVIVLALPGLFGFIDYWFMPDYYLGLSVFYLILGCCYLKILPLMVEGIGDKPYYVEFLIVFVTGLVGAAFFSTVFNLCNELQYGRWACSCMLPFIFPSLYRKMYNAYMDIPLAIYKTWSYDEEQTTDSEHFDQDRILVVELELFKLVKDAVPLNIKAKAPENMLFGRWFKLFLDDYNKKSPQSRISYSDREDPYGWIFYTHSAILGRRKYIDPDLSFTENKIKEKNTIIAKRAQYGNFKQTEAQREEQEQVED
jgi:hypothetical protein